MTAKRGSDGNIEIDGILSIDDPSVSLKVYLDGESTGTTKVVDGKWSFSKAYIQGESNRLDWSLKPMRPRPAMALLVAERNDGRAVAAKLLWI